MTENWPYEPKVEVLEKELEKVKNQLYQTLINANRTVNEMQKLQEQINTCQNENVKLKSQIEELNKKIDEMKMS